MSDAARLVYLSNARLPSEKANALQSLQQCEAFGRRVRVEFWHPRRAGQETNAVRVFEHYQIAPTFALRTIPSADSAWLRRYVNRPAFLFQAASFQAACVRLLRNERDPAVIYTRNPLDVFLLPVLKRLRPVQRIYVEDHDGFGRKAHALKRRMLRHADGVIVTTALHAEAARALGVGADRILVASNGVDLARFPVAPPPVPAGPLFRIVYVGNLFRRKGIFVLVDALAHLPAEYRLDVIGGSPESRGEFDAHVASRGVSGRVTVHGVVPPPSVPRLLQGAHVAALPNSGRSAVSSLFTSPLKMFEYMAAGIPIVASDVPAIRQVLRHDVNAWLVPPDDDRALADGIATVCARPDLASRLSRQARRDVEACTWDARAARILEFAGLS